MKPTDWNNLTRSEKLRQGSSLFASPRGKYIVSQALYKAMQVLDQDRSDHREVSNLEDMEVLYETIFDQFRPVQAPIDTVDSSADHLAA